MSAPAAIAATEHEADSQGDIWLTTSTDKDGVADNDRILHIDIVYSGG